MSKIEVDSHKLMYHPERVAEWNEKGDCAPIYVEIGPTNRCNHRCTFCALDKWVGHNPSEINREVMVSNLGDMAGFGVKSIMFAGEGEPLLHKDLPLFIRTAKEQGMDVSVTTNGVLLDSKKANEILPYLSWIRFSVDAGTRETYSKIHRANEKDFDKVISNIKEAVSIRNSDKYPVVVGIQSLFLYENTDEIPQLAKLLKETGADNFQIKPYSQHPLSNNQPITDYSKSKCIKEELAKLQDDKFQILFRDKTIERLHSQRDYQICHGLPFFALIDARANVIPCNLYYYENSEYFYGNLYENKFSEIWKSERRKEVIEKLNKKGIEGCRKGCRLDAINRYLQRIKDPHPHDNFI